jgi:hypothetical protein
MKQTIITTSLSSSLQISFTLLHLQQQNVKNHIGIGTQNMGDTDTLPLLQILTRSDF